MKNQVHLITALILGVAMLSIPTLATAFEAAANAGDGSLVARGVAVTVPVDVTCSDDFNPNPTVIVNVCLTQRVARQGIINSCGSTESLPIICNNEPHPVTVTVVVQAFGQPFKKGSAFAAVSGAVCNEQEQTCDPFSVQEEIRIR